MPLPRVLSGSSATERFFAVVPADVTAEFRAAVLQRHGTLYDKMGLEVTRALKAHTQTLLVESRTVPLARQEESNEPDDPFMRCLHFNLGEGAQSSEQEPRVL